MLVQLTPTLATLSVGIVFVNALIGILLLHHLWGGHYSETGGRSMQRE
jgi:hypothetical protein